MHRGHVRNNLLGAALARIVETNGNKVVKTNIVNDRGIHICKSMLAWLKWGNNQYHSSNGFGISKKGIRVNAISPGTVLTPLIQRCFSKLDEDTYKARVSGFPLGLGEPTDISTSVIFLLSDVSKWITGQNLIVDGGYTIK